MGIIEIGACLVIAIVLVAVVIATKLGQNNSPAAASPAEDEEAPSLYHQGPGLYQQAPGPDQVDIGGGQLIDWGPNSKHF